MITLVLLLVALVLFVLAALNVPCRIGLQSAGLAFVTAAFLVGRLP